MTVALIVIALGVWVLYSGWIFYKNVNWNEPPVSTPDRGAMRKREKELLHIQELLEEVHAQGRLSQSFLDEYQRYCAEEIAGLQPPDPPAGAPQAKPPKLTPPSKN